MSDPPPKLDLPQTGFRPCPNRHNARPARPGGKPRRRPASPPAGCGRRGRPRDAGFHPRSVSARGSCIHSKPSGYPAAVGGLETTPGVCAIRYPHVEEFVGRHTLSTSRTVRPRPVECTRSHSSASLWPWRWPAPRRRWAGERIGLGSRPRWPTRAAECRPATPGHPGRTPRPGRQPAGLGSGTPPVSSDAMTGARRGKPERPIAAAVPVWATRPGSRPPARLGTGS